MGTLLRTLLRSVRHPQNSGQAVVILALGFIGLALVEGGFTFFSGRLAARTSEGIAQRLRDYLYDHIQRLSCTYHDKAQTGEMIHRSTLEVDGVRGVFAG